MFGAYHELTFEMPRGNSERVYIVAKERYRSNKLYINEMSAGCRIMN